MKAQPENIMRESCRHNLGLIPDIILRNALFYPNQEAFVYGDRRVTFEEYNGRVNSLVHALHDLGVKKGDVLGFFPGIAQSTWMFLERPRRGDS